MGIRVTGIEVLHTLTSFARTNLVSRVVLLHFIHFHAKACTPHKHQLKNYFRFARDSAGVLISRQGHRTYEATLSP